MKRLIFIILMFNVVWGLFAQTEQVDSLCNATTESSDSVKVSFPVLPRPTSTPVDTDDHKPKTVLHYYDKHGNLLEEPVLFLATLDTVQNVKSGPIYPVYNGINVGVNFGDLIFMAFGQKYAGFDVWANVSMHNWFFPTLELGVGYADDTPAKQNFTYKSRPAVYCKIGANYNFLYKSNPDYQVYVGLRAGFSRFNYSLKDVTITSDYWDESQHFSIEGLRSTAFYGEIVAGIQVKIISNFSMGWAARWHHLFKATECEGNKPWYVPGYGGSSPFGMSVSAIWTFGKKAAKSE